MNKHQISTYLLSPWTIQNGEATAPITLIKEGVACGSGGCILWPGHVLEQNASKWEDAPVTLNHPAIDGRPVSIHQSPEIENKYAIGTMRGAYYDPNTKAIKGTIHIPSNHPKLSEIQACKEISMGVFSDETYETGQYEGKEYHACAIAMRPDHAAILPPGQFGACDWEQGCGIRNNAEQTITVFEKAMDRLLQEKKGGTENMEILMPAGVITNEADEATKIKELQEYADASNILLPTQFNRSTEPAKQADEDIPVLMPVQY